MFGFASGVERSSDKTDISKIFDFFRPSKQNELRYKPTSILFPKQNGCQLQTSAKVDIAIAQTIAN